MPFALPCLRQVPASYVRTAGSGSFQNPIPSLPCDHRILSLNLRPAIGEVAWLVSKRGRRGRECQRHAWLGAGSRCRAMWWVWKQSYDTGTLTFFTLLRETPSSPPPLPTTGDQTEFIRFAQQAPLFVPCHLARPCLVFWNGFLGSKNCPGFHQVAQASLELFMLLSQLPKYQDCRFVLLCLGTENHFCSSVPSGGRAWDAVTRTCLQDLRIVTYSVIHRLPQVLAA